MESGAASSRPRNFWSACLRSVMSRMALETSMPSSVSIGLRLISTGNSEPSLRWPYSSRPGSHRAHARLGEKARSVLRMPATKALRREDLDRLPQQLLALVTKQLLYLRVDQDDLAGPIDDDHGVRRGLQQISELL